MRMRQRASMLAGPRVQDPGQVQLPRAAPGVGQGRRAEKAAVERPSRDPAPSQEILQVGDRAAAVGQEVEQDPSHDHAQGQAQHQAPEVLVREPLRPVAGVIEVSGQGAEPREDGAEEKSRLPMEKRMGLKARVFYHMGNFFRGRSYYSVGSAR